MYDTTGNTIFNIIHNKNINIQYQKKHSIASHPIPSTYTMHHRYMMHRCYMMHHCYIMHHCYTAVIPRTIVR